MICNDCVNFKDCESLAMANFDHSHRMWMYDFWENAEQRCKGFQATNVGEARWYINPDGYYPQCSNCWEEPADGKLSERCPNCGFKMGGETR